MDSNVIIKLAKHPNHIGCTLTRSSTAERKAALASDPKGTRASELRSELSTSVSDGKQCKPHRQMAQSARGNTNEQLASQHRNQFATPRQSAIIKPNPNSRMTPHREKSIVIISSDSEDRGSKVDLVNDTKGTGDNKKGDDGNKNEEGVKTDNKGQHEAHRGNARPVVVGE